MPNDESQPAEARILDLAKQPDGSSLFTIDASTTSRDLLATLNYINPDTEVVDRFISKILKGGIERKKGNVLAGKKVRIDDEVESLTSQAAIERKIVFGEDPSYDEVKSIFTNVYGDRAYEKIKALTLGLVDLGAFTDMTLIAVDLNEFTAATEVDIQAEMARLTTKHYLDDEQPPAE